MRIHSLTVGVLTFLLSIASAGADDITIMGLTDATAVRSGSTRPLAYLTGRCQTKRRRMHCHLHEIAVSKVDPTPFEEKTKEVLEQVTQNPHSIERVITSQMPYLCQEAQNGTDRRNEPSPSETLSPGERELRQATEHFCAEKSADNLRVVFDHLALMQAQTCALWVTSADKDFTLRGTEWVSTQGPSGPCGVLETAVLSSPIYNRHGQAIRFNAYRTRHRVTTPTAPRCATAEDTAEDKDYVFVLEKPRYTACMYIDFSPSTFGWSLWQPRPP